MNPRELGFDENELKQIKETRLFFEGKVVGCKVGKKTYGQYHDWKREPVIKQKVKSFFPVKSRSFYKGQWKRETST